MWQRIREMLFGKRQARGDGEQPGIYDAGDAIVVEVQCARCGEVISTRLRKSSDIQRNYDETGPDYYVRKTLVGRQCFNRIEVELELDARYRPVETRIQGGKLRAKDEEATPL